MVAKLHCKDRLAKAENQLATRMKIENCVGRHAGNILTELRPHIKAMQLSDLNEETHSEIHRCTKISCLKEFDPPAQDEKDVHAKACREKNANAYRKKIIKRERDEMIAGVYMQSMADQRKWFANANLKFLKNQATNEKLHYIVNEGRQMLENHLNAMIENKPLYHVQHKYRNVKLLRNKRNLASSSKSLEVMGQVLDGMFNTLKDFFDLHETKKCVYEADRIKTMLERYPPKLPRVLIDSYSVILAEFMGLVYLDRIKFQNHLSVTENIERVKCMVRLDATYNSLHFDAIIQSSDFPFFDEKLWREKYKHFLKLSESNEEIAWLNHEIGRCYEIERKWEWTIAHGYKTATHAVRCGNAAWEINGYFSVVTGSNQRLEHAEALEAIGKAIAIAEKSGFDDTLKFLKIAKLVAKSDGIHVKGNTQTILEQREDQILKLMRRDLKMQARARNLFSRISKT